MWDSFSKIVIHLIDKVSFKNMLLFLFIFSLFWWYLPYEFLAFHIAPRELPIAMYWIFLLVGSGSISLLCHYLYYQFRVWKAQTAWEKVYSTLSEQELVIVDKLLGQDGVPLAIDRRYADNLVKKDIIVVKFRYTTWNEYLLSTGFRAFMRNKLKKSLK